MRLALLLFVVVSVSAGAQDPIPDTTDWHRYIPLKIGNEWHYQVKITLYPGLPFYEVTPHSYEVVGDSLVGAVFYNTIRHCSQEQEEETVCDSELDLVRTDEPSASVMQRTIDTQEWSWLAYPCGLNAPFGGDPQELPCADGEPQSPGLDYYVYGEFVDEHHVAGGDVMIGRLTFKSYSTIVGGSNLLSDAGLLDWCFGDPDCGDRGTLGYARLDGVEYGDPVVIVANEGYPELPERHDQLSIFPNPVRSTATLTYVLDTPGRVTLGVFDLQGRKVESLLLGERSSGEHILELDTARWANGLYQVRITNDRGFLATKGIIVIH